MYKVSLTEPAIPEDAIEEKALMGRQEWVNRSHVKSAEDSSLFKTFGSGIGVIENHASTIGSCK